MFKAVILAAGKGTRMRTDGLELPKVMRKALGKPLIDYVLNAVPVKHTEDAVIVVGYMRELVMSSYPMYSYAVQNEQLGTGHAVMCAESFIGGENCDVLVCCGDMPLVKRETYEELLSFHKQTGSDCTILSGTSDVPLPFGRVIKDGNGAFMKIVEDKDCTESERAVRELNSGVYVFNSRKLLDALKSVRTDNAQGEYYLTDVPEIMLKRGQKVSVCVREMNEQLIGVNTPEQLEMVERELRKREQINL